MLRLMTEEPWRSHGPALTARERAAQVVLGATAVPAPVTLGLDAEGVGTGVSAHLMSRLPGVPVPEMDGDHVTAMAEMLVLIHEVRPAEAFREYQSWAWEAKRLVPAWTNQPASWARAFSILDDEPPTFEPTFLHRDFSHRNLLWQDGSISGVVDWVETSTGPAWLDAAHAATNLALAHGPEPALDFVSAYAALTRTRPGRYWLVMDAVGFLPPPGMKPMFGSPTQLERLDDWLTRITAPVLDA